MCFHFSLTSTRSFNSGNNIYGDDVKDSLLRLQKEGSEEEAAYILMQRIFPTVFPTILVREGICYKEHAISELGIFSAYLRYLLFILFDIIFKHIKFSANAFHMMQKQRDGY